MRRRQVRVFAFEITADKFACPEILDWRVQKVGFLVAGPKGLKRRRWTEVRVYSRECQECVDIDLRGHLFRQDIGERRIPRKRCVKAGMFSSFRERPTA